MRRLAWPLAVLLLATCSPMLRAEVRFIAGVGRVDSARFRASVIVECDPFNLDLPRAVPPADAPPPDAGGRWASRVEGGAFVVAIAERRSHCFVHMTGWYDVDGDGKVGEGDLVGSLPAALEARDAGACRGEVTTTAPVRLEPRPRRAPVKITNCKNPNDPLCGL